MKTIIFHNVYVTSRASVAGELESEGPLGNLFDQTYSDFYCGEKNYESAERKMVKDACDAAIRKAKLKQTDISFAVGGDLINQLATSHYFIREVPISFLGMYAACATSSLVIGEGSLLVEHGFDHVLCFTSSHNACAERQFRYPNEYGVQKKVTTTYTVSGAGAIILGKSPTNIKVSAFTVGNVIDWDYSDANDMGKAMAPAAFETLKEHLKNRKQTIQDYDAIVTGDLSKIGFSMLCDLLLEANMEIDNRLNDCGLLIYDINKQPVFAGGSGCACSMCVSMTLLLDNLEKGVWNHLLVIATGTLLSPILTQQKESIPVIAHAIEYERRKRK